ncbi:helix-turn-helix domain-containing protein [Rhizobium sp. S95]|uniref:Helix-turn-helix domain-containing protein n=1 Tax=Ciceribacter sichuanensis TaxID=2949647 RepID=A0AAJ1F992_9HYPH|nr:MULTISPECIES: helix-turn-helix domain-containing protein [unclassified Ciceribacter]MCM2399441.1 helix-turn-helix domain-containing protein [Ciceribacter sp. S95]MCO5959767.1 helix-turn-helix domain-containing protein [Ciceribacter sp. S101]
MSLLKTPQAAAYIAKSASWLNKSRMDGSGPVYMKNGGSVVYRPLDLDAWMASNRRTAVYDFANDNQRAQVEA